MQMISNCAQALVLAILAIIVCAGHANEVWTEPKLLNTQETTSELLFGFRNPNEDKIQPLHRRVEDKSQEKILLGAELNEETVEYESHWRL